MHKIFIREDWHICITTGHTKNIIQKLMVLSTLICNKRENAINMPQWAHELTCVPWVQNYLFVKGNEVLVEKQCFISFRLYYNFLSFVTLQITFSDSSTMVSTQLVRNTILYHIFPLLFAVCRIFGNNTYIYLERKYRLKNDFHLLHRQ